MVLDQLVEPFEDPRGQRPHDHGAEEHRHRGADDDAHRRDGADHGTALAVDRTAAGVADQQREQVGDDRVDHLGQVGVRGPPGRDDEGGEQAPGDERTDVRHDHPGQEPTELLHCCPEPVTFEVLVDTCVGESERHLNSVGMAVRRGGQDRL
ncbi:hypothetical protein SDC9_98489 [bioreactor metagenome]|uniref:Uncharacterized protein n=1 Tax=bioreactor metagenome TaxID=1076179 RepID=A0A645AGB3_9ZZZZ